MTPTRPGTLVGLALLAGAVAFLVAQLAYGSLPQLPGSAPVTLGIVAGFELALAKAVRDRVLHRPQRPGARPRRPMHPMQVARVAALAKASSPVGALLAGIYGGLFAYTATHRRLAAAQDDAVVSGLSALAAAALVVCALLLERACRVPPPPERPEGTPAGPSGSLPD